MHQIDDDENKNQCKSLINQISPNPATQGYAEYLILNWGAQVIGALKYLISSKAGAHL